MKVHTLAVVLMLFMLVQLSGPTGTVAQAANSASFETISEWIESGQYDQALAALEHHIDSGTDNAQAYFLKGIAHFQRGELARAEASFTILIDLFPQLPEAYINLAAVQAERRDYENARKILQKAISLNPDSPLAYINLGDLYVLMAEQAYHQANRLDSEDAYAATRAELLQTLNAR